MDEGRMRRGTSDEQDRYYDGILRDKYAKGTERSVPEVLRRVARGLAAAEPKSERGRWESAFFKVMEGGFYPAGRIMSAAGAGINATLINCFVQPVGDSVSAVVDGKAGIYTALLQAAETMRRGGGVGYDFSAIRPRGAAVHSSGSRASGPVSYMRVFDRSCETVESAGARRGAQMGVMRVDHPDIEEFVRAKDIRAQARRLREAGFEGPELEALLQKLRTLSNFNISVAVSDEFMRLKNNGGTIELTHAAEPDRAEFPQAYRRDDGRWVYKRLEAAALWDLILRTTYETADPGVVFIDRMNAENNLAYCERIEATNPCVAADTWVSTRDGARQVRDLAGRPFTAVVDGRLCASGPGGFFRTGTRQLLRIATRRGLVLRVTPDHPLLALSSMTRWKKSTAWRSAGELKPGDAVCLSDHSKLAIDRSGGGGSEGYLLGLLLGDGHIKSDKAVLSVWVPALAANDVAALNPLAGVMQAAEAAARKLGTRADFSGWTRARATSGSTEYRMSTAGVKALAEQMGIVPGHKTLTPRIEQQSPAFVCEFLSGLFDADGSVQGDHSKGVSIRLSQSGLGTLEAVQRMLLRIGIASTIYQNRRPAMQRPLPDGRGGKAAYFCRASHELVVARGNIARFAEVVGFKDAAKQSRLLAALGSYRRGINRERFVDVIASIEDDAVEDVFDVQVPGVHRFDANGIVVHNCGEQPLPDYGCCCLGSINLALFVGKPFSPAAQLDWKRLEQTAATAVRMLDNVLDISPWPLPEQAREAAAKRRIGLGFTGLGTALLMLRIGYGSEAAVKLAARLARSLRDSAYRASVALARERGAFPLFDAQRYLASPFVQRLPQPLRAQIARHGIRNSHLLSIAPTGTISLAFGRNVTGGIEPAFAWEYSRRTRNKAGQALEYPVQDYGYRRYLETHAGGKLPPYFVSAQTLQPLDHLRIQAAVQPYVDSSISKTVNVPLECGFEAFKELYDKAYEWGCKGCTTYRPNDVTGAVLSVGAAPAPRQAPTLALDLNGSDRRLRLQKLPAPPLASLKWPGRPEFAHGNPAWTYMVDAGPGCRFAVFVGHTETGDRFPFEVWVNGAEQPRGLGATAKLLSMDLRSRDRAWIRLKLENLIRIHGNPVTVALPPEGRETLMASPTAVLARLVLFRCKELGLFEKIDATPVVDALISAEEPATGTEGTMSWTVDVKNPSTGEDCSLVLKELQMPDGQRWPYAMGLYGEYPRDLDGLCGLLSLDMRVIDPAWIGAKLQKLLNFPETGASFLGRIPGQDKGQLYPSTVSYLAALMLHRYQMLNILGPDGLPLRPLGLLERPAAAEGRGQAVLGAPCPECGAHAVVKREGCQACTSCGWIGNCG